jgi:hypothetical protein
MRAPLLSRVVFPLALAFSGNISALQNLSLVGQDAKDGILKDQYPDYLESWRFLHTALFKRTWPDLELVRLQIFRAPDELLSRFIVKHASSLRKGDLTGCFLGHSQRDGVISSSAWGGSYGEDNFRRMMESLNDQTKLDELWIRLRRR